MNLGHDDGMFGMYKKEMILSLVISITTTTNVCCSIQKKIICYVNSLVKS